MSGELPEFWIDVGGTFTDCLQRVGDGPLRRFKLLSSGVVRGRGTLNSDRRSVFDTGRRRDPDDVWTGYRLTLFDQSGQPHFSARVEQFRAGRWLLNELAPSAVRPGSWDYQLDCGQEAPLVAIRYLLGLPAAATLPPVVVRLGTTRGTNALLTRQGARAALVTTRGFGDLLWIGEQNRPRLFELAIRKPQPLHEVVVELDERLTRDGTCLVALDEPATRARLAQLRQQGIESLAICLLHADCQPQHEQRVARWAREEGFREVSVSSEVAPLIKLVSRAETTLLDAYLNPVLRDYVHHLQEHLDCPSADHRLRMMTSAGGLVAASHFRGRDSILSGPAGGVVAFSRVAQAAGFERAIGFDMGGTSTDVSRFDGAFELEYETVKAGQRIVAPMLAIETVAAGGGSICRFDGIKLTVGPASAGADPGPACYGRGGPLTVTDVNLFLGRILDDHFPFPLDHQAVARRLDQLAAELDAGQATKLSSFQLAAGLLRIANANMVEAIRSVSIGRGCDPRDYTLVAFGGAAAQHACAVAGELGIGNILVPVDAGLLSAWGMGLADVTRHAVSGRYETYGEQHPAVLEPCFLQLEDQAARQLEREGIPPDRIRLRRSLDLRVQGTDGVLTVCRPAGDDYLAEFWSEHERRFGYAEPGRTVEVVAARVEAVGRSAVELPVSRSLPSRQPSPLGARPVRYDDQLLDVPVFDRQQLRPGDRLEGPAAIAQLHSTTLIDPGWQGEVLSGGELLLRSRPAPPGDRMDGQRECVTRGITASVDAPAAQSPERDKQADGPVEPDPVLLEIYNNQFAAIAQQMGLTLRNTALSVNVRERLDFSCAIFTAAGDLVVNAPHIPVHLGAMSATVKQLIADNPRPNPGDVWVTNDPYRGGSHLPDVTVVTPVHATVPEGAAQRPQTEPHPADSPVLFFVASRAHHAEIGGITPGSMPPDSRTLAEEGVVIRNFKLLEDGKPRFEALAELLASGPYPSRCVADNLSDIRAQLAANQQGATDLLDLVAARGADEVLRYMGLIQQAAERKVRQALATLPDGESIFVDHLDNGAAIRVRIRVAGDAIDIDFSGTDPVLPDNLNANRAIVLAAVMYVLRCLIDEPIPLNQGVLAPVTLTLPTCLLNPSLPPDPNQAPAVVGGNVETSQRVVDVLLGALGLAAASQGTMNNLLFGDQRFGYYETICGGAGATPTRRGASAVHTHMTNTRITDPEVLEHRYPVRVVEFSIRRGSGGRGQHPGGDGVVRCLEFLAPLQVSLLTQRRGPYPPFGLAGGQAGQLGLNQLLRPGQPPRQLPNQATQQVRPGDRLRIETPGGGGYGDDDEAT